jgi:hypothetical protein
MRKELKPFTDMDDSSSREGLGQPEEYLLPFAAKMKGG